ncbi:MAG: RHS repeat-associated core domain-containing protein [Polyangiaceae bacterium]
MGTSDDHKDIATTKSGHTAPGPGPSANLGPPPAPTGPVPQPYLYIAQSKSAKDTTSTQYIPVAEALKIDSYMDIERPANQPAQPGGVQGDVVTHAIVGTATCITGSRNFKRSKGICATGDSVMLDVPMPHGKVAQSKGTLILGADLVAGTAPSDKLATVITAGEPVAVVSGAVVDEMTDFVMLGAIVTSFGRVYSSARNREKTDLGRGGFSHSFEQWISEDGANLVFRNEAGANIDFPPLSEQGTSYHRGRRLSLRRTRTGEYEIADGNARRTLELGRLTPTSERAVLRAVRDAFGNRIELVHDKERLSKIIDTARREIRFQHDREGRIVRAERWREADLLDWVDYAYHPEGELASVTDALGYSERYEYDGAHRLVTKTLRNGVRFHYEYDRETADCVRTWGDGGLHRVDFTYDRKRRQTMTSGTRKPRVYDWNADGAVVRERTFDGSLVHETRFDEDALVVAEKNAAGEETLYEYDEKGYLISETDPAGNTTTWEMDPVFSRPRKQTLPDGSVFEYTLGARGELTGVKFPNGVACTYACDGAGRLTGLYGPDGMIFERKYDEAHNLVRLQTDKGAFLHFEHDAWGRVTKITDSTGSVETVKYDVLGRVIERELPDGTHLSMTHDALGNVTRIDDGTGHAVEQEYAGTGTLRRRKMPDGQVWEFEHDEMERLQRVTNPKGETYEFRFNRAGAVAEEKTFDGRILKYTYDRAERVSRIDYDDDTWRTFAYDALGNIVEEDTPHGARTFERDDQGRILKATMKDHDGPIEIAFERDKLGRVIAEAQPAGLLQFEHDSRGRRSACKLPNGQTTRYYHGTTGALTGLDHDGYKVLFQRDALGREVRRHLYTPVVDIFTKVAVTGNLREQVVSASRAGGPYVLGRRDFTYGPHARLAEVRDARFGVATFRHDVLGQLLEASSSGQTEAFEYDVSGALVGMMSSGGGSAEPWSTGMGNVLRRAGDVAFANDDRRRRRERRGPHGEVTKYYWDCRDQLREVLLPSGARLRYWYDAFGRRVKKAVFPKEPAIGEMRPADPPVVTTFLWDGDVIVMERSTSGLERTYAYEVGYPIPVLHKEGGETFAYVTDHVGRPYELIDEKARVAWAASYSAWGAVLREVRDPETPRARPATTPLRQPGHYADDDTGLLSTRHRYFDPSTARWLSPDPIGIQGGPDHFGFAGSPLTRVDVYGLCTIDWLKKVDAAILAHRRSVELMSQIPGKKGAFNVFSVCVIEQDGKQRVVIGVNNPEGYIPPGIQGAITLNPGEQVVYPTGPNSHAERNVIAWMNQQNAANPEHPMTLLASGATIPHCGNCTCAVSNAGGVTSSSIRVRGDDSWGVDRGTGNGTVVDNTENP